MKRKSEEDATSSTLFAIPSSPPHKKPRDSFTSVSSPPSPSPSPSSPSSSSSPSLPVLPTPSLYSRLASKDKCKNCLHDRFVLQYREGDKVCERCGLIADERMISEEAEYRLFNEDSSSQSKVRAGPATSIYMLENLSSGHSRLAQEEKQFLYDGWKNIDQIVNHLFPDSQPADVRTRAKELFQQAFLLQLGQKEGKNEFKKGDDDQNQLRQRFSKRKTIVVAALYHALHEKKIDLPNALDQLNRALEGDDVSIGSVTRCLEELGVGVPE